MHYWTREDVNKRLRLANRQSYRIVRATPSGRISSDSVLAILNRSRVGIQDPLWCVPCDLLTPGEAIALFGVTGGELRRWTRRTRKVAPHFRINRSTVRFSAEMMARWLKENSAA